MIEPPSFVSPDLRALDMVSAEVVACAIWQDERPFRGLAGLLDWRLAGRLSALAKARFLTGERGEVLLVPSQCGGRPKLTFDKLLLVGLGPRASFNDDVARMGFERLQSTLAGLAVKKAVVELPGRSHGEMDAARAADLLAERSATLEQVWTLVDTEEAEAMVSKKLLRRADAGPRSDA